MTNARRAQPQRLRSFMARHAWAYALYAAAVAGLAAIADHFSTGQAWGDVITLAIVFWCVFFSWYRVLRRRARSQDQCRD